jgi:hypothetical protein
MTFNFDPDSISSSQRVLIVQQILHASPNLSHLVVAWKDFLHCSQTYSNLKHLHLLLARIRPKPKEHVDINRLFQLTPNLCRLETGRVNMFNENLIEFILNILGRFHQLVNLTLNKKCLYRSKQSQKMMFKESLIEAINGRLFDSNNIQIKLYMSDILSIWL